MKACDSYEGKPDASEDVNTAFDALPAAHIAAESGSAGIPAKDSWEALDAEREVVRLSALEISLMETASNLS